MSIISSNAKPTIVVQPDVRFATTFLGTKYRDHAVPGEAIMDKVSGELFFKRPGDGKVISFSQNKKYIHDVILELRVLLTNNENFRYPSNNQGAYYLSTDYDLVRVNGERNINIYDENIQIGTTSNDVDDSTIKFNVSVDSNGFFCKPMSRDTDKAIIEFYTNMYNAYLENYSGTNDSLLTEHNKFANTRWKDSNAIIKYTVGISSNGTRTTYTTSDYIRVNEECMVNFPESIFADYQVEERDPNSNEIISRTLNIDSIDVSIDEISFDKMHFVIDNKNIMGSTFSDFSAKYEDGVSKFLYIDSNIQINTLNIMYFVDSSIDVMILGNENIISILDMPFVTRYMMKLAKLRTPSSFISSVTKPSDDEWTTNSIWGERISDISASGVVTKTASALKVSDLENVFSSDLSTVYGTTITVNEAESQNILFKEDIE